MKSGLESGSYTIFPYWDDLRTDIASGCATYPFGTCGIFTSVTGSAPNRIFDIEWRTTYTSAPATHANFELKLFEGQTRFDVIYGTVDNGNGSATAGVQRDDATFDEYFCSGMGGAPSGGQSYTLQPCGSPTPTPTQSPTPTPTATPTPTPGEIVLTFQARRGAGRETVLVRLMWTGANSPRVDIYRNGEPLARVDNTGTYTDTLTEHAFFTYKVCEGHSRNCSNEVTARGP